MSMEAILYESYGENRWVKTWDPLRRTPVIKQTDEHTGVEEVGGVQSLFPVEPASAILGIFAGLGIGLLIFPTWLKRAAR